MCTETEICLCITHIPTDAVGPLEEGAILLGTEEGGATHDLHGDTGTDLALTLLTDMIHIGRDVGYTCNGVDLCLLCAFVFLLFQS